MERLYDALCRVLDFLSATCLMVMVVLVFGNVVLRYGFNSGITVSEELSRWLFVWMTFMGALVAIRHRGHLGVDMVVTRLPRAGKKLCLGFGLVSMLYVCYLIFVGSLDQTLINMDVPAPATGLSTGLFYGVGLVFAVIGALFLLSDLIRLVSGRLDDAQLVQVKESEEAAELEELEQQFDGLRAHGQGSAPAADAGNTAQRGGRP